MTTPKGQAVSKKHEKVLALEADPDWQDEFIEFIAQGNHAHEFAKLKGVPISSFWRLVERVPNLRAREAEAREKGAHAIAAKAEAVLLDADGTPVEINRASHLAKHYQWLASKFSKTYADKQEVNVTGQVNLASMIKELDEPDDDTLTIEGECTPIDPVDK